MNGQPPSINMFKFCVDDNYGTSVCNFADRLNVIFICSIVYRKVSNWIENCYLDIWHLLFFSILEKSTTKPPTTNNSQQCSSISLSRLSVWHSFHLSVFLEKSTTKTSAVSTYQSASNSTDLMHKSWSGPCTVGNGNLCIVIGYCLRRVTNNNA